MLGGEGDGGWAAGVQPSRESEHEMNKPSMSTPSTNRYVPRSVVAGAAAAALVAIAACGPPPNQTPPPLPAAMTASWAMNERSGRVMTDSAKPPANNGVIGPAVRLNGSTYDFPGWESNVDTAGNFVGQISATDSLVSVADSGHELEPRNGAFSVDGILQARRTAAGTLPVGARGVAYNIVQKARASNLGGFWKVEMRGNGLGIGRLVCTLGDGRNVVAVESTARMDNGARHSFACRLNKGIFAAVVDGVSANADASILGAVNPVERFSTSVSIGKKPGSTDPSDSFSGWIDQLNISAG